MVSGIVTGALIVLFIAGWVWAWSPRRKADFEDEAKKKAEEERKFEEVSVVFACWFC